MDDDWRQGDDNSKEGLKNMLEIVSSFMKQEFKELKERPSPWMIKKVSH